VLPEASGTYLLAVRAVPVRAGRGILGGRANSVDSDRRFSVGGRTVGASASRLPDAKTICSAK
jgi:hypothetical protein